MTDGKPKGEQGKELSPHERRAHARLHVSTKIKVVGPLGRGAAVLRDLSFGGARFVVAQPVGGVGHSVELVFVGRGGLASKFTGTIVRIERGDEETVVAVRFEPLELTKREGLKQVINLLLAGPGGGMREHPRLAHSVDVRYRTLSELRGILQDISRGGFAMTVREPIDRGQEVLLFIPDSCGDDLLMLRAHVVHCRASAWGPSKSRLGLRFTEMSPERQRLFEALLAFLIERGKESGDQP